MLLQTIFVFLHAEQQKRLGKKFYSYACVACKYETKKEKRTVMGCMDCEPHVALHAGVCFELYHKQVASGAWKPFKGRKKRGAGTNKKRKKAKKKPRATIQV